jgi:hypothetical protein
MADTPTTTAKAVWTTTLAHRAELIHNLNQNPDQRRDLEDRLVAVEERLLDLDAPDLEGVALKLSLLWEGKLHGQDRDSEHKLAVLADLRRLTA